MGNERTDTLYQYGGKRDYYLIRHEGLYDIEGLLKGARKFLKDHDYYITDKDHSESIKGSGREIKLSWVAQRRVERYVHFYIEMIFITWRQIDVIVDDKKVQKGEFELQFKAYMKKNPEKTFKGSSFEEIQRHIYEKFIVGDRMEGYEDKLYEEATDLINTMKEHLD